MVVRLLSAVSDRAWEVAGMVFGAIGAVSIGYQILHELRTPGRSSVSVWFVAGFLSIYVFWLLYGIRFRRPAIWLSNAAASALQLILGAVVILKG